MYSDHTHSPGIIDSSLKELKKKGWNNWDVEAISQELVPHLSSNLSEQFENSPLDRWFQLLEIGNSMSATRSLLYSQAMSLELSWYCGQPGMTLSLPFKLLILIFWKSDIEGMSLSDYFTDLDSIFSNN